MAAFSSARLAAFRRWLPAAPRPASLRATEEDPLPRGILRGQLLPRLFSSDASGFIRHSPPSGLETAAQLRPQQNFNRINFVHQDSRANIQLNFNNTNNGAPMTAAGDKPFNFGDHFPFGPSRVLKEHEQYSPKKRDFIHILLKKNKTFVTVTDASGNKKTGASAGCLEDRKGRSCLS